MNDQVNQTQLKLQSALKTQLVTITTQTNQALKHTDDYELIFEQSAQKLINLNQKTLQNAVNQLPKLAKPRWQNRLKNIRNEIDPTEETQAYQELLELFCGQNRWLHQLTSHPLPKFLKMINKKIDTMKIQFNYTEDLYDYEIDDMSDEINPNLKIDWYFNQYNDLIRYYQSIYHHPSTDYSKD